MKTWHATIAISLLAATTYWWGQRRQRSETDELRSSVQTLTRSLQDTNRAVAHAAVAPPPARRAMDLPAPAASPPPAGPSDPQPPAVSEGEPGAPQRIDPAELRGHLDTRFGGQADDPAWSATARGMIERKLSAAMPPSSTLKSVECRQTMCRIEMVYDNLAQYQAFFKHMTPDALPWNGTLFSTPVGDPSEPPITFVAFLSREGQQLAIE